MRALLHRTVTVVFDHAAPEDGLSLVVGALEFEPGVVGIDGASGEKVSDFFRADDYVHAPGVAAAQDPRPGRKLPLRRQPGQPRDLTAVQHRKHLHPAQ